MCIYIYTYYIYIYIYIYCSCQRFQELLKQLRSVCFPGGPGTHEARYPSSRCRAEAFARHLDYLFKFRLSNGFPTDKASTNIDKGQYEQLVPGDSPKWF